MGIPTVFPAEWQIWEPQKLKNWCWLHRCFFGAHLCRIFYLLLLYGGGKQVPTIQTTEVSQKSSEASIINLDLPAVAVWRRKPIRIAVTFSMCVAKIDETKNKWQVTKCIYVGPTASFSQLGRPWNMCGILPVFPTESNRVVLLSPKNRGFVKAHPLADPHHSPPCFFFRLRTVTDLSRTLEVWKWIALNAVCGTLKLDELSSLFHLQSLKLSSALRWMHLSEQKFVHPKIETQA